MSATRPPQSYPLSGHNTNVVGHIALPHTATELTLKASSLRSANMPQRQCTTEAQVPTDRWRAKNLSWKSMQMRLLWQHRRTESTGTPTLFLSDETKQLAEDEMELALRIRVWAACQQ